MLYLSLQPTPEDKHSHNAYRMAKRVITPFTLDEDTLFPQSYSSIKRGERARYIDFHKELNRASVEEDVKAAYRKFFSLPQDSSKHHDLYTYQMLFEFKYDKKLEDRIIKAEVLAQLLYYVHRLKFDTNEKPIPPFLCLADINEAVVTETILWEEFYNDSKYDWSAAPSSPDTLLIQDLANSEGIKKLRETANVSRSFLLRRSRFAHFHEIQQRFSDIGRFQPCGTDGEAFAQRDLQQMGIVPAAEYFCRQFLRAEAGAFAREA